MIWIDFVDKTMSDIFRTAEQENFSRIIEAHIASPDAPLLAEGATGLGKTRAYLVPLLKAAAAGKRVAIILPTHQLIDQLLASSDITVCDPGGITIKAFRPKRFFDSSSDYAEHRNSAIESDVLVCTSASVIIDQRLAGQYNGVTDRDYMLFDEADQLPEVASLQSDREVSAQAFKDLNIKVFSAEQAATDLLNKKHVEPEDRAAARIIIEALEEPAWYHTAGLTDDGGIRLFHRLPGRLLKKISNGNKVAFISATLSISNKFDDFKRSMGITMESRFSTILEPNHHGSLVFHLQDKHPLDSDEWQDELRSTLFDAERPALVVTPSHDLSMKLGEMFPEAVVRQREETTAEAALRLPDDGMLIAAGAWAGLDTPIQWLSVVIPRIPFPRPEVLDDNIESHYLNIKNTATRRMRQVIGRGLRRPDAKCSIYLHDPRWKQVESFVPARFVDEWNTKKSYSEGRQIQVTLSKSERSSYLRKLAIKHYGLKCYACDLVPRSPNQIDIHHKEPIAEGERETTIEDLVPLCANCHRLAHSETPPLTVDFLRELV